MDTLVETRRADQSARTETMGESQASKPRLQLARVGPPTRQALVLAAGRGSRLGGQTPKPLHRLLGVPLLARNLLTLERAGITDAYVVLGYRAEEVRREMEAFGRLGLRVHWLYNRRWERGNGVSVLAGAEVLTRPFVLAMGDHIFDVGAVERLFEHAHGLAGVDLLVDSRTDRVPDVDEATKVVVAGGRIVEIGKSLERFDAIDTGLFLATPKLFEAIERGVATGRESLSDGVGRLARESRARAIDGGDFLWADIDTPSDAAHAERKLLDRLVKAQDGPVARAFNRRVSRRITRRLVGTGITPNQVSIATLGVALVGAAAAAVGGYVPWVLAGVLFQVASILDGVDGEVATLTFRASRLGEWVDTVSDNTAYVAFLAGLTVGVARAGLPDWFMWAGWVGVSAAIVGLTSISLTLWRENRSGSARAVRYAYQETAEDGRAGALTRVFRFLHYFGKRDVFSLIVLLMALAGLLPYVLPIFAVGGAAALVPATVLAAVRAHGRMIGAPMARAEAADAG